MMKSFIRFVVSAYLVFSIVHTFNVQLYTPDGPGPTTETKVKVFINFEKEVEEVDASKFTVKGFTIEDLKGNGSYWEFTAVITSTFIWGESTIRIPEGVISDISKSEYNSESNIVGVTYGPSLIDNFEDCYDIKNKFPDYKSGLYYITFKGKMDNTLVYCEQESAGGGWTLFYANSGNPHMETKKSYVQYQITKSIIPFSVNNTYWSYNLGGMIDYTLLSDSVSLMGKDIGPLWKEDEYAYITFPDNKILQQFVEHRLISGTSCTTLSPSGTTLRYRNSNGANYLVQQIENWNGDGYGWKDCMASPIPEPTDSKVENSPRHIIYNINHADDDQRTRGLFGYNGGDSSVMARYFIRPSKETTRPVVNLLIDDDKNNIHSIPFNVICQFSDDVYNFEISGIECKECKVTNLIKSVTSDSTYYATVLPSKLSKEKMSIKVLENAAENKNGMKNLASEEVELILSDDIQHYTIETKQDNGTCSRWFESWKSNENGHIQVEFGVVASDSMRISLSPVLSNTDEHYIIQLNAKSIGHKIIYAKGNDESIIDTFSEDFKIEGGRTAIIHIEYKDNNFTLGIGTDFRLISHSFKPETTIDNIKYVTFCGGISTVTYHYLYVGSSSSENPLSVVLENQSHNPTTMPFTIIATTSENFKSFDVSKLHINYAEISDVEVETVNPRQVSIFITPRSIPSLEYEIYIDVAAFTSHSEKQSMKSNTLSIVYDTTNLKAELTADNISKADVIPLTVTITFNREVKSFSVDGIETLVYLCKIINFKEIASKVFTIDIIPESDHVRLYVMEDKVFDLDGNPNVISYTDIFFDFVKRYVIPQMNGNFYTFLETWSSTEVGKIWSTFNVTTSRSLIIALTTRNAITDPRIMIYLGLKDSEGRYNLHRITKIENGIETVLANITKNVGISSSTVTPIWFRYDTQTITIGTGGTIDVNTFLNATNVKLPIQFLSFTSGEAKVFITNIDIGERSKSNNPTVKLETDVSYKVRSLPITIRATFSEDVVDYDFTFENAEYQHKEIKSRSVYEYLYYPNALADRVNFYLPPGTTIGYSTSLPNTASNELFYSVDFVTSFTTYTFLNRKPIWNKVWKFDTSSDLVVRFTVKTESGIEMLFGDEMDRSTVLYRFRFGDSKDDTCRIIFERDGEVKEVASIKKNVADPSNHVPLWVIVNDYNIYRMGVGNIPDQQTLITYIDENPVQTPTPYFTFIGDNSSFDHIQTGRNERYFTVDWIYEVQNPIKTLPVHVVARWNKAAYDFTVNSITSENCRFYNFITDYDRDYYSFDVTFVGKNDCRFYVEEGAVRSFDYDRNEESETVILYYSEEITEFNLKSHNDMKFNLITDSFKSNNGSQIYSKFSIKCEDNTLIGFPKDASSTEFYGFYIGGESSIYISVGWYSMENVGNKTTFHSIERISCPLCEKDKFIDLWLDVYDDNENGKTLKIGSGNVMDENIILKRTDYDHPSLKNTSYIAFTNVNTSAYIKNIIVGPGPSDKEKPIVQIITSLLPPFAYLPVNVVVTFSESVTKLDKNKIELKNCRISKMIPSNHQIELSLIPISSDTPATIHIPAGAVTDLSGNPNEESNTLQILMDDISIFSISFHDNEETSYTLWYDQWKSSVPGNIIITVEAVGDRRCIGLTKDRKEPYPIYDVCFENSLLEIRKLNDETSIDTLLSLPIKYIRLIWIILESSKVLKIGEGKEAAESTLITSFDLKNYEDVDQLQYVSFMGKGELVNFANIIVLPCGSSGIPSPTFKPKVPIPSNVAPIPIELYFSEPITGLSLMSFEAKNGMITNLEGSGRHFSLNYLPKGNEESVLKLLKDVTTSRAGFKNPETSIIASYQSEVVNYTFNYYAGFFLGTTAWKSNAFGRIWAKFTVRCENNMIIRLSPWIDGGYPQYNFIFSESNTFHNYFYKIDEKTRYSVQLKDAIVCHKYDNKDYWIYQDKSEIKFGKGITVGFDVLLTYKDTQPIPSNYISFSGGSLPVYYTNIEVGRKKEIVLNGIMYSRDKFPTNVKYIQVFVEWNHDVDDFALEDDVIPTNGIVKEFKVISKKSYSFVYEPTYCGLGFIEIPKDSAHYKDDDGNLIGSDEFVPLYIDFCDERPNPIIKGPSELYVSHVPFVISVSFKSSVYGFTSEDITVSQPHAIYGFRKNNELNYEFEIVIIGNATEIASLYIDENQLTDVYGNQNKRSLTITLPQYGSMIKSYTITTNMNDSPLYLRQWSTGAEMNTEISFDVNCNNDVHVSYSSELYDSENLYEFMIGVTNNIASRFFVNHKLVKEVEGGICKPGEFIPMWFSFHKRVSKFGIGYIEDGDVRILYEDDADYHFKYIGLSNYNDPVSFRNITIGPVNAMPPRTDITTSAITYITSRNPVEVNISFTNDCLEFKEEMINTTSGYINGFREISKRLYTFMYVPIDGVNSIFIPEGICHDSENRKNEKSIIYLFEYTKGSFACKFETSSGQSVSITPIAVTLLFSEATEEFKLDVVSITGGYAFLSDLEHTADNTIYTFKVYFQDFEPTYLSIKEGVIHDIHNNKISQSEMFLLPRYDNSLIAFTPTTGLNGIPFYTSAWEAPARSNIYVKFQVKCAYSAGIGFSKSTSNNKTNDLYEIELGALQNSKTTVRKGLNQKVVESAEGAVCEGLDSDVRIWVECRLGVIRIGRGDEIGKNIILKYEDDNEIRVKYVYFTTYTIGASYSNIDIGPKDLTVPYLEVLNILGNTESIKGTYRLSMHGHLWCISLIFPSNRPSSEYIMDNGNRTYVEDYPQDILMTGLMAGSQYDVWCYAEDKEGVAITLENMDNVRRIVTVPGGAEYPVITIYYIQGRKTSIYIDFTMDKTGYFYALAVKSGSKTPSIDEIKEKGIRVVCTLYDELAISIVDLETMIYYDVYFYSERVYGTGATMDYVIKNMRTVRTDGSCPSFHDKECAGNGRCDDGICICNFGYHKTDCSQHCPGLTEDSECNGNGNCVVNVVGDASCVCESFYYGIDCSVHCPNDGKNECGGEDRGSCNKETGECNCKKGYKGYDCSGKTLSVGAIVGIVIGVVAILVIALIVYYLYKTPISKRLTRKKENEYSMFA